MYMCMCVCMYMCMYASTMYVCMYVKYTITQQSTHTQDGLILISSNYEASERVTILPPRPTNGSMKGRRTLKGSGVVHNLGSSDGSK